MISALYEAGFHDVLVLNGDECGVEEAGSVILAIWTYEADAQETSSGVTIHPYYPASQTAYRQAARISKEFQENGIKLRNDIRVKPIFSRLPGFTQGKNTLSYIEGIGSRFHVQIFTSEKKLPQTHRLLPDAHELHCGNCRKCEEACPTNALDGGTFHRDRCLRQWMLSGKTVPEELCGKMGNRLLGCDECQRCCPHNSRAIHDNHTSVLLHDILTDPKSSSEQLRDLIGANLAIPNRVLSQACINAGCSGDRSLIPLLNKLVDHPSEAVRQHAKWAFDLLSKE